jgi:predicted ester cyclase
MGTLQQMYETHITGLNAGDVDAAVSVFDDDVEIITPNGPMQGVQAHRALVETFRIAVPDGRIEVLRTLVAGDTIVAEGTYSGTHTGPLAGPAGTIPATGRSFAFPFCDVLQAGDGTFTSHRIYWDNASFLSQLGLMSAG